MTSQSQDPDDNSASRSPGRTTGEQPEPTTDPAPAVGPGGVDAVPDWEDAGPDTVVPDPPRSAQVEAETVPDELDDPEGSEVTHDDEGSAVDEAAEGAEESPSGAEEPAD